MPESFSPHRNMIYEEQAEVIANIQHEGDQFIMRLHAPKTAAHAKPGQFIHLQPSSDLLLRRPISIMHTDIERGMIDLLIKAVGRGTHALQMHKVGAMLPLLGPIGRPFDLTDTSRRYLCIGGGVGIPPMIFAADQLRDRANVVVFAGSEIKFPFALKPSGFLLPGIHGNAILGITSLEDRGIASRLASNAGLYGCFEGHVPDLAKEYLLALDESSRNSCTLLACGPTPMLHAVARLAREFHLAAQLSLEAHMACGIGGCAGCVVKTVEHGKEYYRRVCVDGPVFPADVLPEFAS